MEILVHIEVSDRNEMESISGLHGQLLLKERFSERKFALEGTATLTSEREIAELMVLVNELDLSDTIASWMLMCALYSCWHAVVIDNAAMAGSDWLPLPFWIAKHAETDDIARAINCVKEAFTRFT